MIKEVEGDILLTSARAIAHGVGPNDNFAQGLALSLREMWPALYKDFRNYCHLGEAHEGGVWFWRGPSGPSIINLFTQERPQKNHSHPGPAKLDYVNHCLRDLAKVVNSEKIESLALPRLSTGVGGLQWDHVRPLIEKQLGSLKIPVFLYTAYHKGQKAKEN